MGRQASGFTLFELLIVLAITGLALSVSAARWNARDSVASLTLTSRLERARLAELRHSAIQSGRPSTAVFAGREVTFYPDGSSSGLDLTIGNDARALSLTVERMTGAIRIGERAAP